MKELFRIGEVSKIYDISIDTLRYYDEIGLLKPVVDKNNGYRYYSYQHLDILEMVLTSRKIDLPLANIKRLIESENIYDYQSIIEIQQILIKEKIDELTTIYENNNEYISFLKSLALFKNDESFSVIKSITNPLIGYTEYSISDLINAQNSKSIDQIYIYDINESGKFEERETVGIVDSTIPLEGDYDKLPFYGTQSQIREYIDRYIKHEHLVSTSLLLVYKYAVLSSTLDHNYYINIYNKKG